jgi:hypothetical protein
MLCLRVLDVIWILGNVVKLPNEKAMSLIVLALGFIMKLVLLQAMFFNVTAGMFQERLTPTDTTRSLKETT